MLGKLTKYLRILGVDTEYVDSNDFGHKLELARESGRLFLTRNTEILRRRDPPQFQFINSNFPEYQLLEVVERHRISPENPDVLRRCLRCNTILVPVEKDSVRTKVPEYVFSTQDSFSVCIRCNSIYWKGTHYHKMFQFIENIRGAYCRLEN